MMTLSGVVASTTTNAAVVRRMMEEVWGHGRLELVPELVAHDFVGHYGIGDHYGPEGVRIDIVAYRTAFPDLVVALDDILTVDDRVVRRFTLRGRQLGPLLDIPTSGRSVALRGMAIDRLVLGQLVESWVHVDVLPLLG